MRQTLAESAEAGGAAAAEESWLSATASLICVYRTTVGDPDHPHGIEAVYIWKFFRKHSLKDLMERRLGFLYSAKVSLICVYRTTVGDPDHPHAIEAVYIWKFFRRHNLKDLMERRLGFLYPQAHNVEVALCTIVPNGVFYRPIHESKTFSL